MWIMLTRKLPTRPSPPKLSIFWSTPWPMESSGQSETLYGNEPDCEGARKIHFAGSDIRVFPHEFSALKPENMRLYVLGEGDAGTASHELVPEGVASDQIMKKVLKGDDRAVYDAALVDGATPDQAMAVACGVDITLPDAEFPPLGWYRCRKHYAKIFCEEWEMVEHREV